jgi:hypothetical protein
VTEGEGVSEKEKGRLKRHTKENDYERLSWKKEAMHNTGLIGTDVIDVEGDNSVRWVFSSINPFYTSMTQ